MRLRRWTDLDIPILEESNAPEMTEHLGGPEDDAQIHRRHERYLRGWDVGMPRMFAIVDERGTALGSIGWWESEFQGEPAYETGWSALPSAQGRGVAKSALALLVADVRAHGERRPLTAFPSVHNAASNALCRAGGFELRGTQQEEFRGAQLQMNVWVLDPPSSPDDAWHEHLPLLVYGTLREGEPNVGRLGETAQFGELVRIPGVRMYQAGWHPFAVWDATATDGIVCQVVRIPPADFTNVLAACDDLEGTVGPDDPANWYDRVAIEYPAQTGPERAWIYVASATTASGATNDLPEVPGGDWVART